MAGASRTLSVCAALAIASCSSPSHLLLVHVKSDLVPGIEAAAVAVEVTSADGTVLGRAERPVTTMDDLFEGLRVLELGAVAPGELRVQAELRDITGASVLTREASVSLTTSLGVTLIMTRSCVGVRCPLATGDPALSACLGGRCVDPRCTEETPDLCGAPECSMPSQCAAPAASCASARCVSGVCLAVGDAASCAMAEYCDPSMGCWPTPGSDAGTLDAGTLDAGALDAGALDAGALDAGALDAGSDAGSDAGPLDAGSDAGPLDAGSDAGPTDAGFDAGPMDAGMICRMASADGSAFLIEGTQDYCPTVGPHMFDSVCARGMSTVTVDGTVQFDISAVGEIVVDGAGLRSVDGMTYRITVNYAGTSLVYLRVDGTAADVVISGEMPSADLYVQFAGTNDLILQALRVGVVQTNHSALTIGMGSITTGGLFPDTPMAAPMCP